MRPDTGFVCQSLIVLSNCIPGSPHCHVASEISRSRARAVTVSRTWPSVRAVRFHGSSATTLFMKSSVARTELLAFWNWMECQASPLRLMS